MKSLVSQRLTDFVASKKISHRQFEKECGLYQGFINSLGRTIANDKLELITKKYPDLSVDWLLTGRGEMYTEIPPSSEHEDRLEFIKSLIEKYEKTIKEKDARIEKLTDILLDEKNRHHESH